MLSISGPPNEAVQRILYQAQYFFRVQYLQGSPLCGADLIRAKASDAQAVLFMTNKFTTDPNREDARTIMHLFSVRRHLESLNVTQDNMFLCVQVILPENAQKLESDQQLQQSTVCLNKMRMGVIAKSCIYPGTSTLLFNLLNSYGTDIKENENAGHAFARPRADKHKQKRKTYCGDFKDDSSLAHDDHEDDDDVYMDWDAEYKMGAGWEIYTTEIAARFSGYPFMDIARVFYDKLGVVLFAIKVKDLKGRKGTRLLLNPSEYVIPSPMDCFVEGFVIAEDISTADLSFVPKSKRKDRRMSQAGSFVSAVSSSVERGKNFIRRRTGTLDTGTGGGSENGEQKKSGYLSGMGSDKSSTGLLAAKRRLLRQNSQDAILTAQEKKQKKKDEEFRLNYYVAVKPIDLEAATVKTFLLEEFPLVRDHIVVTGKSLNNLIDFILPLRERKKGKLRHIVVLYKDDMPYHVWSQISIFDGIFFLRGSSVIERDLQRAGVFRASHFVLLAGQKRGGISDSDDSVSGSDASSKLSDFDKQGGLEDADAIFAYKIIRRMNEDANIVIEMVRSAQ